MKLLIDFSTFNAIESLFRKDPVDPWARELTGRFADAYAYASQIEIPWPTHNEYERCGVLSPGSALVDKLDEYDSVLMCAKIYKTDDIITLRTEYYERALQSYFSWAHLNLSTLRTWGALHRESWVCGPHRRRVLHGSVCKIERDAEFIALDRKLAAGEGVAAYAFDVILRYPFYGRLTPPDGYYLNHPIRDAILLPGISRETAPPPIGISFDSSVRLLSPYLDLESYVELLTKIRVIVNDLKLKDIAPGQVDCDIVRMMAAELRFPAKLRDQGKLVSAALALLGGFGATPALGPVATISGAALGLATVFWEGQLPRELSRLTWLRWAFHWDLENQIVVRE